MVPAPANIAAEAGWRGSPERPMAPPQGLTGSCRYERAKVVPKGQTVGNGGTQSSGPHRST